MEKQYKMGKRYMFFASHAYAYSILRPLQQEIWRRGDEVAWYLEPTCTDMLVDGERRLTTFDQVKEWNPIAVFAPGNWIYDFFPGVKVCLFHGYPINKRATINDDHFRIRGWFDMYCTQGPSSTIPFRKLEERYGYFKVYETGWTKTDTFLSDNDVEKPADREITILYATTFTRGISSAWCLADVIGKIAREKPWRWILTFHPKITDETLLERYRRLADECPNVEFRPNANDAATFRETDVMLCDTSSIILEYMLTERPVVTYRNTHPGMQIVDVAVPEAIVPAIEYAASRPAELIEAMDEYMAFHEAHRDGGNCRRVLDAVDDFIANHKGRLRRKPLNLIRKIKLRLKLHFYRWTL